MRVFRGQLIQIGYANGQEKSFVYPIFFAFESPEFGIVELTSAAKLSPQNNELFFRENRKPAKFHASY
jgi:hypothetical protein